LNQLLWTRPPREHSQCHRTSAPPMVRSAWQGPTPPLSHTIYKRGTPGGEISFSFLLAPQTREASAAATHSRLNGNSTRHLLIPRAQRHPKSSRCFCPQFCSSSSPPVASTLDLVAILRHLPERAPVTMCHARTGRAQSALAAKGCPMGLACWAMACLAVWFWAKFEPG
jgi:hypothetical protein